MADIKVGTRFGELSIDPSQIITIPRGIPGFENSTRWTLFHELDEQVLFVLEQADTERPGLTGRDLPVKAETTVPFLYFLNQRQ